MSIENGMPAPQEIGLERSETVETKPLHTPYYDATLEAFGKEISEKKEDLEVVLNEIDEQAIKNFSIYQSQEAMPGVAFSYTKLSVTPELIQKLSKISLAENQATDANQAKEIIEGENDTTEEATDAKRQDYFLFSAFAPPPDGHAFTVQDVGIDRFIRLMPRVARPMKQGEQTPEVNVYLIGAPTGLGGVVTQEWIDRIKQEGLETHAKLYAEFVKQQESNVSENVHVVLQGVSKGAVIAEKTSKYLPEELQEKTQRLLDNPAGGHKPGQFIKGAEVVLGLGSETAARMLFDNTMMKPLTKSGGKFTEKLAESKGIPKEDSQQKKLKLEAVLAEGLALVKGSALDTESVRSFIRKGIYDPLTFSPDRLLEISKKQKEGIKMPMFSKGKSLEVPFKGNHFFFYNRYKRWAKILDYVKGYNKN